MNILSSLKEICSNERAKTSQRFFKTAEGQYGHGDVFLGATVPQCREIAMKFLDLGLPEIEKHLHSKYHEERLIALFVLTGKFARSNDGDRKKIYDFYLANKNAVNNWDLVDSSADKIVGGYLSDHIQEANILDKLAKSNNLWDRRIAIVGTYALIKKHRFIEVKRISEALLQDKHDLIHKAVGWMLREMGKRDIAELKDFLAKNYKHMPRTMLRYSIERFPQDTRKKYLQGEI